MNLKVGRYVSFGKLIGLYLLLLFFFSDSIFPILLDVKLSIIKNISIILVSSLILLSKRKKWIKYLFPLLIASYVSIIFNKVSPEFNSLFRLIAWIVLLICVGPLVRNKTSHSIKKIIFFLFPKICCLIGIMSFFYWAINLPVIGRGFFTGLMNHSMMISPIANFGLAYLIILFFLQESFVKKVALIVPISLIFIVCIIGASRAALLGSFFSCVLILFIYYRKQFVQISFVIILLSPLFVIYNMNKTTTQQKIKYTNSTVERNIFEAINRKGSSNTRELLWEDRFNEFFNSPIIGSGFAAANLDVIKTKKMADGGRFEFGSSYLAIVSTLGVLGIVSFIYFLYPLKFMFKNIRKFSKKTGMMIIMYVSFFGVHQVFEGYFFAIGSSLSLVFWSSLGYIYDLKYFKTNENIIPY